MVGHQVILVFVYKNFYLREGLDVGLGARNCHTRKSMGSSMNAFSASRKFQESALIPSWLQVGCNLNFLVYT